MLLEAEAFEVCVCVCLHIFARTKNWNSVLVSGLQLGYD